MANDTHSSSGSQHSHHHILPVKTAVAVGAALLVLTAVTVGVAYVDLGALNFFVAMLVATCKATLVGTIFMNLYWDRKENAVIFITSFLFLAIFIVLTASDLWFRGNVYVTGPVVPASVGSGPKVKDPWKATPELMKRGQELFAVNCASCHGDKGQGDGPAAGSLNPKPRNFVTASETWKNGRKPTMVFKTLKDGIPGTGMASFATLPSDDRWALSHYVLSLGAEAQADTAADFAKIGVDPSKGGGGAEESKTIPVEVAIDRLDAEYRQSHSGQ